MDNYTQIDRLHRRVLIRAQSQWTLSQAEQYLIDMQTVLDWASESGDNISLYADLDGLVLHTAEVSKCIEDAVVLMEKFPIQRYALIVPSYLMRMQCRRLLANIDHNYFESREAAFQWLGWDTDFLFENERGLVGAAAFLPRVSDLNCSTYKLA